MHISVIHLWWMKEKRDMKTKRAGGSGARLFVKSRDRSHSSSQNHFRRRRCAPIVRPSPSHLSSLARGSFFLFFVLPRPAKGEPEVVSRWKDTAVQLLLHKTVSPPRFSRLSPIHDCRPRRLLHLQPATEPLANSKVITSRRTAQGSKRRALNLHIMVLGALHTHVAIPCSAPLRNRWVWFSSRIYVHNH